MRMKKIFAILFCWLPLVANAYVDRPNAVVRVMNKDAGKVQEFVVPVGQELQFEKIFCIKWVRLFTGTDIDEYFFEL